jgi:D-alanyl-D-alanine carboxypeptidase
MPALPIARSFRCALLLFLAAGCSAVEDEKHCEPGAPFEGPGPSGFEGDIPTAPTPDGILSEAEAAELQRLLEEFVAGTAAQSGAVTVWHPGKGRWSGRVGEGGTEALFWWASVGKLATSALIFQLVDEGQLSLEMSVEAWFPDWPEARFVTVEQLLRHRSGVFSFNEDEAIRDAEGYLPPEFLIETALSRPLLFCPGTNWSYSNTGYVMLAWIAERVTGLTFAELVETRIAEPLGLDGFVVAEPGAPAPGMIPGVAASIDSLATVHGAGGILASSPAMARFLEAWLAGELFAPWRVGNALAHADTMPGTALRYGMGVMIIDVDNPGAETTWIGHLGGAPQAKGVLVHDQHTGAIVALAVDAQSPAEALVNAMLKSFLADEPDPVSPGP